MSTTQEFNATVIELMNDLASAVPSFTDLSIVANLASGMYRLDPGNTTLLETFYPLATQYSTLISERNDEAVLTLLENMLPGQHSSTAKRVWGLLSDENKEAVWQYIDLLQEQASKIKSPKCEKGLPDDSELYVIYNKIWKEFITLTASVDDSSNAAEVWSTALKSWEQMNDDPSRVTLYKAVADVVSPVLGCIKSSADVMLLIMPRETSYMTSQVEKDLSVFKEEDCFPFNPTLKMSTVLELVKRHDDAGKPELAMYWHYVKVLTTVLGECPAELGSMLSSMAANLGPTLLSVRDSLIDTTTDSEKQD